MEKKKVVPVWLSVILLALALAGTGYYTYSLINVVSTSGWTFYNAGYIPGIIGSTLAIVYCLAGYKKRSALIFKIYCIVVTLSVMIVLYGSSTSGTSGVFYAIMFFALLIQCGLWFVLTIAKDLGKKKSLTICTIIGLLQVVMVIMIIPYGFPVILSPAAGIVYYIITFLMFYGKYKDKEARGTK